MRKLYCSLSIVLICLSLSSADAKEQEWKKTLLEKLLADYPLTRTKIKYDSVYGDTLMIAERGASLVLQQSGIKVTGQKSWLQDNVIENGRVLEAKGAKSFFGIAEETGGMEVLKSGDFIYVEKIDVKDDGIKFRIVTRDAYETVIQGSIRNLHFVGAIVFKFPDGVLKNMSYPDLKRAIDSFVQAE